MEIFFEKASDEHVKRERAKARELRKSQWWKNQLGMGKCHYCEQRFHPSELTMDHKVPIIRGGESSRGNVVTSCKECNTAKKYYTPADLALLELS